MFLFMILSMLHLEKRGFIRSTSQAAFSMPPEKCYEKHHWRKREKRKEKKIKTYRNCIAEVAPQIFSYRGKSRQNIADMRDKIATGIKRRKCEWLRDCERAPKKFGYMKNCGHEEGNTVSKSPALVTSHDVQKLLADVLCRFRARNFSSGAIFRPARRKVHREWSPGSRGGKWEKFIFRATNF